MQCGHDLISGAALGVTDIGTGATLGTAGVWFFWATGIVGAMGGGCSSCAGLACAGSGAEM